MNISLILNGTSESLDYLKYCALYFDKITVEEPLFYDGQSFEALKRHKGIDKDWNFCNSYFDWDIQSAIQFFQDNGICETTQKFSIFNNNPEADNVVFFNPQLFFGESGYHLENEEHYIDCYIDRNAEIKSEEAREVIRKTLEYIRDSGIQYVTLGKLIVPVDETLSLSDLTVDIYERLLRASILSLECGQNIITNSGILSELLGCYYGKKRKRGNISKEYLKTNVVKVLLPNLCKLNVEDIVDIRAKAAEELGELRLYVDEFLKTIPKEILNGMSQNDIDSEIKRRLTPRITRFERALESFKKDLISHKVASIGSIAGYSELISNCIFTDPRIAGISSLAAIGISVFENISYYEARFNELKNDPLYFTLKLTR